jgi:hypothetical protein
MKNDNKLNLVYFESTSVRKLYDTMDTWQKTNRKRLQSVSVQRDGGKFCCIALTNPTEVIITDGTDSATVSRDGSLHVTICED